MLHALGTWGHLPVFVAFFHAGPAVPEVSSEAPQGARMTHACQALSLLYRWGHGEPGRGWGWS